jgi:hypothetical protein
LQQSSYADIRVTTDASPEALGGMLISTRGSSLLVEQKQSLNGHLIF